MEKFSFDTIENFDNHIELSIPNYKHIWELVNSLSTNFIRDNTTVYDLGCSTGIGLKNLSENQTHIKNVEYKGLDISDNLITDRGGIKIVKRDITDSNLTFNNASLILSIFTVQFLHYDKKIILLKKVYDSLLPGGAFIITEKTFAENGRIQDILTFTYYDYKLKSFSEKEIFDKQFDLRFIMKSNTKTEIENMLKGAGFKIMDTFFQSLNFRGWICIK